MQGTITDKLAAKHIPALSRIAALPRAVAASFAPSAPARRNSLSTAASHPLAKAAGGGAHAAPLAGAVNTYIYTGNMKISGNLSASSNQHGTWSGNLTESMSVSMDVAGNGYAYESFSGEIHLHVVNPDDSTKDTQEPLVFSVSFSVQRGHFSYSEPSYGLGGNLLATLTLKGSFQGSHAAFAETMHTPFNGFVNEASVSGALNGKTVLKARAPLTISGVTANQTAYAAQSVNPFKTFRIADLDNSPITATVTLSNPKNGRLTNLAGGNYKPSTGVYTITGKIGVVNRALHNLAFTSPANLSAHVRPVKTGFAIRVTDGDKHSLVNRISIETVQPLSIKGISSNQSTTGTRPRMPFHQVTIGDALNREVDTVKITMSNPNNGTLSDYAGGGYYRRAGVYLIHATAEKASAILRELTFHPSSSATSTSTTFTISVKNPAGAYVTDNSTTVTATKAEPATISGESGGFFAYSYWGSGPVFALASSVTTGDSAVPASGNAVALFTQHVAAGLHRTPDHAAGIAAAHEMPSHQHFTLATSHA